MGTLGEVRPSNTSPKRRQIFLVKGLTKSVVKILIRKGLSNPSLSYFSRKGMTNPSKKNKTHRLSSELGVIPNLSVISFLNKGL